MNKPATFIGVDQGRLIDEFLVHVSKMPKTALFEKRSKGGD